MSYSPPVQPLRQPENAERLRKVFVRDLVLNALIGVHRHEKGGKQRVRINIELFVRESDVPHDDKLAHVVCYEEIVTGIRRVVEAGHVNLVETLAENIAGLCLADPRVRTAKIRVEKLDVFPDADSVGVEIERTNP